MLVAVTLLLPVFLPEVDQRLQLDLSLAALEQLEDDGELTAGVQARRRALEVQVASGLRTLRAVDATPGVSISFTPSAEQQLLIDRIVAEHPDPSPAEVAEAASILGEVFGGDGRNMATALIGRALPLAIVGWLFVAPRIALVSAVVCRGGLLLRMLGIALVTQQERWRVVDASSSGPQSPGCQPSLRGWGASTPLWSRSSTSRTRGRWGCSASLARSLSAGRSPV